MKLSKKRKRIACITGSVSVGGAANAARLIIAVLSCHFDVEVFSRESTKLSWVSLFFFRVQNGFTSRLQKVIRLVYLKKEFVWSRNYFGMFGSKDLLSDSFDMYFIFSLSYPVISDNVLRAILKSGRPVFWRLSDMRPFTGGCHYSNSCTEYVNGCMSCPGLLDNSYFAHLLLIQNYHAELDSDTVHFLFPSSWLQKRFELVGQRLSCKSSLIPTMVNPVFKVRTSMDIKKVISNEDDRKVILFGADNFDNSLRKGWPSFLSFMRFCSEIPNFFGDYILACYGTKNFSTDNPNVIVFGEIGQGELSNILNHSDVYVNLSSEDNLPNSVMEALACGVCIVSTLVGGIDTLKLENPNSIEVIKDLNETSLIKAIELVLSLDCDRSSIAERFLKNHSDLLMHDFVISVCDI